MARATSYLAPWNPDYNKAELKKAFNQGYKRATKKSRESAGLGYSMSRGYYDKESDNWGPKPKEPLKKKVHLATGRWAWVIDDDFGPGEAYGGFDKDDEISEYIDTANFKYSIEGCGHIQKLEYAPYRTLMRATFTNNGAIYVYFRVPTAVFGELYWLAESKVEQASPVTGESRHALGIKFWDLVRIRGTRNQGRYRYTIAEAGKAYHKKGTPVSKSERIRQERDIRDFGEDKAAKLSATRQALQEEVKQIKKSGAGQTDRDETIISLFGNKENAKRSLDNYSLLYKDKRTKAGYDALATLTDKYNHLLSHGLIDDWLNGED